MNRIKHSFGESILIYEGAEVHSSCDLGPFTIIYPGVHIGENVQIGASCIIGKKPKIGKNQTELSATDKSTVIQSNAIICDKVIIYNGVKIGEESYLADGSLIRENVTIEENVVIGTYVVISFNAKVGAKSKIMTGTNIAGNMKIGKGCFFGAHVCAVNDNKPFDLKERSQQISAEIKNDVFIGAKTTILPDLVIEEGIQVAAGSIVTKDLRSKNALYMGSPAKIRNHEK